jgi:ADP-ribosyl-[dinitrogen reductase] hydrolase
LYVKIGKELLKGKSLETILDELECSATFSRLKNLKKIDRDSIQSGGYVVHTLEASLWCILNTATYSSAVLTAVNLGDDTDTTAAVTGALAGLIYGYEDIPKEWIDKLANKELIDSCLF